MPVVLVEVGGVARSGHEYDDRTGIAYEYPAGRYENWIHTGDRFVYQVPKIGYTGCGIVGDIQPSGNSGRLRCDVLSVRFFDKPVGLNDAAGLYYEADQAYWKDKVYWGQGVRPLSDQRFDSILAAAGDGDTGPTGAEGAYAEPANARLIEHYSVEIARAAMQTRFKQHVEVMQRNNPGFDMRVGPAANPVRYIEVKGTRSADPVFFMSEGERKFSVRNASRYTLVVVPGINLANQCHGSIVVRDGSVQGPGFELAPSQWRGRVLPSS